MNGCQQKEIKFLVVEVGIKSFFITHFQQINQHHSQLIKSLGNTTEQSQTEILWYVTKDV